MCPPVIDGQPVNASISNAAWLDAVDNDAAEGIISFENTDPASGAFVDNIQKESNSAASFMGKTLNSSATDLPVYTNNEVGAANDPLFDRVDALSGKFNATGGHAHTGAAGDAPAITASDLASVPLRGFIRQGVNVTTGAASSVIVTADFAAQTPGGSALVAGVVTDPPYNKVLMRQTTGAESGDKFTDADGNEVYGRLTYAALNWTLSFYVDLAGVETAYTFPTSQIAAYFYQEIFNPMVNPPTYSEFAIIPSDNVTADVVTATTAIQGKVSLATTAQNIGSTTSGGTANAVVANADHTHRGISDISKSGDPALYGSVTLSATGGTTLTQAAQDIAIDSVALTASVTPEDVAGTAAIGVSTESAHADHVHAGVYSVDAGFGDKLGTVTVGSTGATVLSDTVTGFSIDSPAFTVAAATDVASAGAAGVSTDMARADHAHRGVASVAKFGSSQLFGDVTFTPGTGITINQVGQDLEIVNAAGVLYNNTPQAVGSVASAGVGTDASRDDHVHEGLHSISKSGDPQILGDAELVAGTGITLTQSGQQISIAASGGAGVPVGTIVAFSGGYFTGANNTGTWTDVLGNTIATVNSYVASSGFVVCDGTAPNDPASPIFDTTAKYLPNLTDSRFLQGSTAAGTIGGSNSFTLSATNLPAFTISTDSSGAYSATTAAGDGHGHGFNLYTRSVHSASNYIRNQFVATDAYTATRGANITISSISTAESFGVPVAGGLGGNSFNVTVATTSNLASHAHSITTGPGNGGMNSTAVSNQPKYFSAFYIIRIK